MNTHVDQEPYYNETERLSPEEFSQKVFDQGEFILIVWDRDKFRLNKRIKALMLLGYHPVAGTLTSHTVYEEYNRNTIPVKEDLCILMVNESMYQNAVGN
jgi:hypothetical protein